MELRGVSKHSVGLKNHQKKHAPYLMSIDRFETGRWDRWCEVLLFHTFCLLFEIAVGN